MRRQPSASARPDLRPPPKSSSDSTLVWLYVSIGQALRQQSARLIVDASVATVPPNRATSGRAAKDKCQSVSSNMIAVRSSPFKVSRILQRAAGPSAFRM
jgi:hypothetical protein